MREMARRVPAPLWMAVLLMPMGLRFVSLALNDLGLPFAALRGFASDLLFGGLIWLLSTLLLRWANRERGVASGWRQRAPRWVGRVAAVALVMIYAAGVYGNFEHVLANDANVDPGNLKFLGDKTFRAGSALTISHPALLFGGLFVTFTLALMATVRLYAQPLMRPTVAVLAGLLVMQWVPLHGATAGWAQENPALGMLRMINAGANPPTVVGESARVVADLSGTPVVKPLAETQPKTKTPNVLIIMLEGLSGMNLPSQAKRHGVSVSGKMPAISALADKNVSVTHFISHQRQTDRGEYSLLCGDLPKLSRDTPRMSDFAVHGADMKCLPATLAQRGYQTLYLQPAPMAFMMKDQFMVKAGFERSLGADYFVKGYAKSGWGVDDRAFFEQSYSAIKKMDDKDEPWMAALMTVGTHHPFVVPKRFKAKEGEHNFTRALRYTDRHLSKMIERMRHAGMLKDTIVVITSDESRGMTKKYGGVTRAISQNWGLMVMLLPDGQQAVIDHEIFGQEDLAVTLLDYAGLYHAGDDVGGRSMFRRYKTPRTHAFANIFKRKAYLLSPAAADLPMRLTSCKQGFNDCTAYTRDDDKVFGPGWTESDADPVDVLRLRRDVAQSAQSRGKRDPLDRTQLVHINTGVVSIEQSKRRMYLIGGQFLYAPPGKRLQVDLDIEIDGPGAAVKLSGELNIEAKDRFKYPKTPILVHGDRLELSFWFEEPGPLKRVDVEVFVRKLAKVPTRAIIRKAEARFVDEAPDLAAPRWKITRHRVSYRDGRAWVPYADQPRTKQVHAVRDPDFILDRCVKRGAQGQLTAKCRGTRKMIAWGPRVPVPAGSTIRARFLVRGIEGRAKLKADMCSAWGNTLRAVGDPVFVGPGDTVELIAEGRAKTAIKLLEGRLSLVDSKTPISFEILEGELTIEPDAPRPTQPPRPLRQAPKSTSALPTSGVPQALPGAPLSRPLPAKTFRRKKMRPSKLRPLAARPLAVRPPGVRPSRVRPPGVRPPGVRPPVVLPSKLRPVLKTP